jgi:hypothetical protein
VSHKRDYVKWALDRAENKARGTLIEAGVMLHQRQRHLFTMDTVPIAESVQYTLLASAASELGCTPGARSIAAPPASGTFITPSAPAQYTASSFSAMVRGSLSSQAMAPVW